MDKKDKVRAWLEKKMEDPICVGLDFGAYLIMPIQRTIKWLLLCFVMIPNVGIPRYRLLLEEFLGHTPQTHRDYKDLQAVRIRQIIKYK